MRKDIALQKFKEGYNCAQSVFYAFCDDLKIDKNTALKIASGFGAGMARMQEVCGAVSGAIMALGSAHGRGENEDREIMVKNYNEIRELMDRFKKQHGSYNCLCLLKECSLNTEEGHKFYSDNDLRNKVCVPCVGSAVEIVEDLLKI